MISQKPPNSQAIAVTDLLVGFQRQDDVPVGLIAIQLVADHVGDKGGRDELVVARATPEEIAVLFDQLERIERPVLGLRLYHVEMSEKQDRPARASAAQTGHQIALARRRLEDLHVCRIETR